MVLAVLIGATDVFARVLVIVALAFDAILSVVAVLTYRRARHRVSVALLPSVMFNANQMVPILIVSVTSIGRPMAVNDIVLKWDDPKPFRIPNHGDGHPCRHWTMDFLPISH